MFTSDTEHLETLNRLVRSMALSLKSHGQSLELMARDVADCRAAIEKLTTRVHRLEEPAALEKKQ